jgi:hypothetical protein
MHLKTYNIFISHSWKYNQQYEQIKKLLDAQPYFKYRDYSVPRTDPIHGAGTDRELSEAIKRQMDSCHVVIILAGVYSTYSKWIDKEINLAKGYMYEKPIIAVEPWASKRASAKVKENANVIVGWNGQSIVNAIRGLSS